MGSHLAVGWRAAPRVGRPGRSPRWPWPRRPRSGKQDGWPRGQPRAPPEALVDRAQRCIEGQRGTLPPRGRPRFLSGEHGTILRVVACCHVFEAGEAPPGTLDVTSKSVERRQPEKKRPSLRRSRRYPIRASRCRAGTPRRNDRPSSAHTGDCRPRTLPFPVPRAAGEGQSGLAVRLGTREVAGHAKVRQTTLGS